MNESLFQEDRDLQQPSTNSKQNSSALDTRRWLQSGSVFLYFIYLILPFIKQPYLEASCTASFLAIPLAPYLIVESLLMFLLLVIRLVSIYIATQPLFSITNVSLTALLILEAIVNLTLPNMLIELLIRPVFCVLYFERTISLFRSYFKIVSKNLRYYLLMWLLIAIFWASGDMLFDKYEHDHNIFRSGYDAVWNLLVLQSTANYPDVALPFYQQAKPNMIFFLVFVVANTMIMANIIIATSYNAYKTVIEDEDKEQSVKQVLVKAISYKQTKLMEEQAFNGMSKKKKAIHALINNNFFKFNEWIINIILFAVVCYHPPGVYSESILYAMILMTLILTVPPILKWHIYPFEVNKRRPFLIYTLCVSFFTTIVNCCILFSGSEKYNYLYPYLILLRIPVILKPIIHILFKQEIHAPASLAHPSSERNLLYRFFPRLSKMFLTLFLIMLLFSAIGQMIFAGMIVDDTRTFLLETQVNQRYIFLNFNSTLSSFMVLFSLLIVNNWNYIVEMFVLVSGTRSVRIYFMFFYLFAVLVAYNLLLASIIECVVKIAEQKQQKLKLLKENSRKSMASGSPTRKKLTNENIMRLKKVLIKALREAKAHDINHEESYPLEEEYLQECIKQQLEEIKL